ncbi:MAG: hypothetical protein MI863_20855 [Desulfobacterales bacterium]|nr:hypothetical protein [Desulfobacterales bacterium]
MIKLNIIENGVLGYSENIARAYCWDDGYYSLSEKKFSIFTPHPDGKHQYKVEYSSNFFNRFGLSVEEACASVEQKNLLTGAYYNPQCLYYLNDKKAAEPIGIGSLSPRFDLLSPEIMGRYKFTASNPETPFKFFLSFTESATILLFPQFEKFKWPALIFPAALVRPKILTHVTGNQKKLKLCEILKKDKDMMRDKCLNCDRSCPQCPITDKDLSIL